MNALDALFSRQVPTRSPNVSSNAGARDQGSGQSGSFASALSSGRPDRPEQRTRNGDDNAPVRDEAVDNTQQAAASDDREIDETDQSDDADGSQAIDLLALLAKRAENSEDDADEDGADEIVIEVVEDASDEDEPAVDETALEAMQKLGHGNNGVDGKAVAAAAVADGNPRATIIAQQTKPVTGNADKGEAAANAADGAADGRRISEAAVAGGGKSDDAGANAGREGQRKGEADMAELDPVLRAKSASVRGEGDVAMDKVEVLEKRSVSGMSQNAENVAKALVRDASGLNPQTTAETGEAAALRHAAAAERANAAAMAPRSGQTLHTLRIQLNPESLGQVTAVMRLSDGELKVELKVQSAEAYRQLTDDSSAIAKALRQQGYGIDQITVQQTNAGSDKSGMNAQQGQTSGQQFQFREGMAQNGSGGNGNSGDGRGRSTGGQNGGELGHEVVSGNTSSSGASDGVYL
ncbi:flagellar hook-length control protein FliK [Pseudohoeflea suaedae]|uniref:Flagellar hook-length control protein FliK n=1 Tax=Pseudohoeflea suaedae TaxID=877384 RepID=A0A4R5PMR7_9HYPH|nr:flagellar hook-length control protein FliK [Pseudohoeflea suaedae]TDH38276.1 flagellar hook-length control protein FliK [Pseudohoeflea suaedae]